MPLDNGPMVVRKTGWKARRLSFFGKLRNLLPRYRLVVLFSIAAIVLSFAARMGGVLRRAFTLRSFRRDLLNFLNYKEKVLKSEIDTFLQSLQGWEETIPPQEMAQQLEKEIQRFKADPRLPELYFHLGNAYYLAGNYIKHSSSFLLGLEKLKELRTQGPLAAVPVKFLFTEDWGWGIGHITMLDTLVKLRELGLLSSEERIVVLSPEDGANKHYLRYWKRHLRFLMVSKSEAQHLLSMFQPLSEKLSGFELKAGFSMMYEASNLAGTSWDKEKRAPLLELQPNDFQRGWETLEKFGMSRRDWFVTLHVREYNPNTPNHLRVRAAPNADIRTYLPAIRAVIAQGGWVVRIGDPSMSEMPRIEGLIDYANSEYKSDWMDVFLCASCRFFIGTSSGPLTLPPSFGVPVLYTNSCGMGFSPALGRSIVLPKLFWSRRENRLLKFREILASPIGWTVRVPEDPDIEIRDNESDEIEAAVEEMLARLEGKTGGFEEFSALQKRFSELRQKYGNHASTPIADSFARKHKQLLQEEGEDLQVVA